jgi:hypothetical protein
VAADRAALLALAARIEALAAPCREVDAEVMTAFGHEVMVDTVNNDEPGIVIEGDNPMEFAFGPCPRLTASLDAALALMAEVLPGVGFTMCLKPWGKGDIWMLEGVCSLDALPACALTATVCRAVAAGLPA